MDRSSSEKKLLQSLYDKEHFIEQVTNSTPDIIYVFDLERRKNIYTNKRVMDILGPENRMLDSIHPQDYPRRIDHINACKELKEDDIQEIDIRLKVKDESWHWFRMRDIPFKRKPDGTVSHIIGTARDIHNRKLEEEVLQEKEALLQGLLNSPNLGISVCKAIRNKAGIILDFEFLLISKTMEEFHQRKDLIGKWLFEEFPDRKSQYEDLKNVVETGEMHAYDTIDKERWCHISIAKFADGFIKIREDVTEKMPARRK